MIPTEKFDMIVKLEEHENQKQEEEILAIEQIEMELENQGPYFYIKESEFYNVYMVELRSDKIETALKLANAAINTAFEIVPIEYVVVTRQDQIIEKVINISKDKIKRGETFKVKCNIRGENYINSKEEFFHHLYHEMEKINILADENNPDWVVHIEVVGENTGVSVMKSGYTKINKKFS